MPTLATLCTAGHPPLLVVSQPSRPGGRGRHLRHPPVIEWAQREGIPTAQPARVSDQTFLRQVAALEPDVAIVVAFGQIFPSHLLDLPRHGCINLHASLLPRYRGAAPIARAIASGESTTGVTTMLMNEGLDTGDILLQRSVEIGPAETAEQLSPRLANLGAELVIDTLKALEKNELVRKEQSESEATLAPRLTKLEGRVDWSLDATTIFDSLRALTPWPGSWSELGGERIKIVWGKPIEHRTTASAAPGVFLGLQNGLLLVSCGNKTIFGIERLQRPGRKLIDAAAFANGEHLEAGENFE